MSDYKADPAGTGESCPLASIVIPSAYSTSSHGHSCDWTGGHCMPGNTCDDYRARAAAQDARWERAKGQADD